uniref:Uncharacterized protein n=1 Tax=Tetradesmus obliquus TaxID=3088 RepID=A0A383VSJ9_TETOB|eukprot:jgi/Sobl393_1/16417/SZX67799.1
MPAQLELKAAEQLRHVQGFGQPPLAQQQQQQQQQVGHGFGQQDGLLPPPQPPFGSTAGALGSRAAEACAGLWAAAAAATGIAAAAAAAAGPWLWSA